MTKKGPSNLFKNILFFGYILCYVVNEHYYSKVTHREKQINVTELKRKIAVV